jgi:primosomal protein N' (replication factor Y)
LQQRKQFEYPPFVRLIRCELKHRNFSVVQEAANWIGQALSNHFPNVLGPQSPAVGRVRNHFLMHLMIKLPADKSSSLAKEQLARIVKRFEQIPSYRSVKLGIDVDPT